MFSHDISDKRALARQCSCTLQATYQLHWQVWHFAACGSVCAVEKLEFCLDAVLARGLQAAFYEFVSLTRLGLIKAILRLLERHR